MCGRLQGIASLPHRGTRMTRKIAILSLIVLMLTGQASAYAQNAQDDLGRDLSRIDRLIIPVGQQCAQAEPVAVVAGFEGGNDAQVSGASPAIDERNPLFGQRSLLLHLSGSTPATVRIAVQNPDQEKYTGIIVWVRPSVAGIKASAGVLAGKGSLASRPQALRYSGEALPAYIDFASMGAMAKDLGGIKTITLTFTPVDGGDVVIDNVGLADASYGSFNQAWWDEGYGKHFVDQRYQETINDYLSLYTIRGDTGNREAIVRGMDNIILSRQPDGWVEGGTTGLITAGTLGATLANAYGVLKNDSAMDDPLDVYGDASHTRRWWVEKTLDMDVRFIDYLFSANPNNWIVRNQLMEGARATYCAYLATGNASYLVDYRGMMGTIKAGRQDPLGIYPEWTGAYDNSKVLYDASYSAVQLSALMSLAALGDREYALPMARDLFGVITNVVDPSTGMLLNLNSSRKELEGDLRWQDGLLYYLGTREDLPGFVHLGYLENRVAPGKNFPDNFHSALARYYNLKYYAYPAADNAYRLPLEYPAYSIDLLDKGGNVLSTQPAYITSDGSVTNPQPSRDSMTFIRVNGFSGNITPSQTVKAWFDDGSIHLEGSGPVTVSYDGKPAYEATLNGVLDIPTGGAQPSATRTAPGLPSAGASPAGISSLTAGFAILAAILLTAIAVVFLARGRKM